MLRLFILILLLFGCTKMQSQNTLYFPDKTYNANWDTVSPSSLGWCTNYIDTVLNYVDANDSKGFIILQDGKIALEHYTGTFTADSFWYWASAGKTITSLLTGIAQEEGFLAISDTTSKYLGNNWTSCSPSQEGMITIRNQLTMTSGLDDAFTDPDCQDPSCLQYLADAGTRWAYHNAAYLLLQSVISSATGVTYSNYTNTRLNQKTGMFGFWLDSVYYSRTRDMARFGLMILNEGVWNQDTLLHDSTYFHDMVNTSQNLNNSYGYLWWLNGKGSYMVPGFQLVFPTDLIPNAPDDMIAALGKNDQKIYVIPSQNRVIVRMGNTSGSPVLAVSSFDNQLWAKLDQLFCTPVGIDATAETTSDIKIFPNPVTAVCTLNSTKEISEVSILDLTGKFILQQSVRNNQCNLSQLTPGCYLMIPFGINKIAFPPQKIIKIPE
ncbi:serine hydrolase [soil metagenome]